MRTQELKEDEMKAEYDFSNSRPSPYAAMAGEVHIVTLDPDVHAAFSDSQAVNDALRLLMKAAREVKELSKASQERG